MKYLLLALLLLAAPVWAANKPAWYPDHYQMVGKITSIDIEKREITIGDAMLGMIDNVSVHSLKAEYYPLDKLKVGEYVGLDMSDDGGKILVKEIWLLGDSPEAALGKPDDKPRPAPAKPAGTVAPKSVTR